MTTRPRPRSPSAAADRGARARVGSSTLTRTDRGVGYLGEQRVRCLPRSAPTRHVDVQVAPTALAGRTPPQPDRARAAPIGGPVHAREEHAAGRCRRLPTLTAGDSTGSLGRRVCESCWRASSALKARVSAGASGTTVYPSYGPGMPTRSRSTRPRGASTWRRPRHGRRGGTPPSGCREHGPVLVSSTSRRAARTAPSLVALPLHEAPSHSRSPRRRRRFPPGLGGSIFALAQDARAICRLALYYPWLRARARVHSAACRACPAWRSAAATALISARGKRDVIAADGEVSG